MPDDRLQRTRQAYRDDFWRLWRTCMTESHMPFEPVAPGQLWRHVDGREWLIGTDGQPEEVYAGEK